jgi:hypothetical protein
MSQNVSNNLVIHLPAASVKEVLLRNWIMLCTHDIPHIANGFSKKELVGYHVDESRVHLRHIGCFQCVVIVVGVFEPLQGVADNPPVLASVLWYYLQVCRAAVYCPSFLCSDAVTNCFPALCTEDAALQEMIAVLVAFAVETPAVGHIGPDRFELMYWQLDGRVQFE